MDIWQRIEFKLYALREIMFEGRRKYKLPSHSNSTISQLQGKEGGGRC